MENSLADSTIKQYNITFKLWWEFCQTKDLSPFCDTASHILSFFQELLNNTNSTYGSFNYHRSAISLISSIDIGKNPLIKRFLKAVFRKRPPKPKYDSIWNPQEVLNFLDSPNDGNLKALSSKLITLLALATGQRIQTLSLIKCSNIVKTNIGIKILIPELIKTSGPKSFQPCLTLPYLQQKPYLCVASLIVKYLEETKDIRQKECEHFWLTYKKPHGPATKQTLSRWIKDTLKSAGINTSIFSTRSTRHASTSFAYQKGLSYEAIRTSAGWSKESSVVAKFYNRPIGNTEEFLPTVFGDLTDKEK
ncbi:uncharacterized protein LOC126748133 [Anthonomus grandis grandis]|uniref:uncharacterized protein LOC126748133 n=1 Tax=Anthonomus grandis grandis TaxID=2921223 RepID=UPI002165FEF0|nr:uncharacterized protein LOC126748133 [Anthonomus grandis grandis]